MAYPKPTIKKCINKILQQMDDCIYKINEQKEKYDIGFFCHIKYNDKKIPVLIANNNIISHIYNNKINLTMNNESKIIELGETLYKNKDYNLSIIEINKNEIKFINFLEIEENLNEKDYETYYGKESIYTINYTVNNDIAVSYGIINNIYKSEMRYICNTNSNTNFFPIFSLSNHKLIGINYKNKNIYSNKGIFIHSLINQFINKYIRKNLK